MFLENDFPCCTSAWGSVGCMGGRTNKYDGSRQDTIEQFATTLHAQWAMEFRVEHLLDLVIA